MLQKINTNKALDIDKYLHLFTDQYFATEMSNLRTMFKDENIWGKSDKYLITLQYQVAFNYLLLLKLESSRDQKQWSYYQTKYEISKYIKVFRCNGIDLKKLLIIFDLPDRVIEYTNGVGSEDVENTLIVEDISEQLPTPEYNLIDIIGLLNGSINKLDTICPVLCSPKVCCENEERSTYLLWTDLPQKGRILYT